jgi:hypothetical protein
MSDSSKREQKEKKEAAELQAVEKINSETIPNLFHDAEERSWVRVLDKGRYETFAVDSPQMRHHLEGLYYQETKRNSGRGEELPSKLLKKMVGLLRVMALHDGEERKVSLRVGADNTRVLYLDLCDKQRRVVRISPTGWELVAQPPVFFRRTHYMLPLPIPERGGSIDELEPFLNIIPDVFVLVQGWLLTALRSSGPYSLMALIGPAGSAKSTFTKILRDLTDPNQNPYSGSPHDGREFKVAALNNHVLAYDNLSSLTPSVSDALCRQATGAGNTERQYHTNNKEVRFPYVANPIILNGVTEFVTRPDLLDRAIILHLQHIDTKRTEAALKRDYNAKRSRIFGAILNLLVEGVRNLPTVRSESSTRMVEAITWCEACGLTGFENCYKQTLIENNQAIIENNLLGRGIVALMERTERWTGIMTELQKTLEESGYNLPMRPNELSNHLKEIEPALRTGHGIAVKHLKRGDHGRRIEISKVSSVSSGASSTEGN